MKPEDMTAERYKGLFASVGVEGPDDVLHCIAEGPLIVGTADELTLDKPLLIFPNAEYERRFRDLYAAGAFATEGGPGT